MIRIVAVIIAILIPCSAFCAPSVSGVSGTITTGETITISGSSFGSHPDYHANVAGKLAWLWQDFEVALHYDGLASDYPAYWVRLTAGGRSGYWAYRSGPGGSSNIQGLKTSHDANSTGVFFLSYWTYRPATCDDGKTVRLRFGADTIDWWYNFTSGAIASDEPVQQTNIYFSPSAPSTGTWHRVDHVFTANSQKVYQVGANSNNPISNGTWSTVDPDTDVQLNLGAGYDDSDQGWGFDDVYANFTVARVEICAEASWASRAHCEIQPVSSWSTQIQATVNQGTFIADDTAYVYVVDSAGTVNSTGYQITIGGEVAGDTTAPTMTGYVIPATSTSLTVPVTTLTATDAVGVTGYCINESASAPTSGSCTGTGWQSSIAEITFDTEGAKTTYAWAKDLAGNVSTSLTDSVTITLPIASTNSGFVGKGGS